MESWVKDLNYFLMPARHPVKGHEKEYYAIYNVWRSAWEKYRNELGIQDRLNSDGFIVADEIGAIFYQGECVGFTAFTHGTIQKGPMKDQSWFSPWPQEAISKLSNISTDVIICSQFTVNPKFAGKNQVVRWKEIVSLYAMMRFDVSDSGVMAGFLNLIRGMQNACGENNGATVIIPEHFFKFGGIEVPAQLVAYERHNIEKLKKTKQIEGLCDDLWSRLIHLTEFSVHSKVLPFKKVA